METALIILAIMFWALCALGIVCLIVCTFVYVEQHREEKRQLIVDSIFDAVMKEATGIVNEVAENIEKDSTMKDGE